MKLEILIPTFHRKKQLKKNLNNIISIIANNDLKNTIGVFVSDNCSEDGTKELLQSYAQIHYLRFVIQKVNIGGNPNISYLLTHSDAEYLMLLGDDDYFDDGYLLKVMSYLTNNNDIELIIPNCYNTLNYRYRNQIRKDKVFYGSVSKLDYSFYASQMSGIVYKNDIKHIKFDTNIKNVYSQIYFTMNAILTKNKIIHILSNPLEISMGNTKYWQYPKDCYFSQIEEDIELLDIRVKEKRNLLLKYAATSARSMSQHFGSMQQYYKFIIDKDYFKNINKKLLWFYLYCGLLNTAIRKMKSLVNKNNNYIQKNRKD